MVSAIHQHESPIVIYMCPLPVKPFSLSHPSRQSQTLASGLVCLTANFYCLSTLHMAMYMFQCYSLKSSYLLSPPLCPKVCSLCLHLCCCHVGRFISTIFLDPIYVHSVQSLSCVQLFVNSWTAAPQASLSFTNFQSLLKLMSIESVMSPNHLILCHPLFLLPSGSFPVSQFFASGGQSIGVSASASVLPMNIQK